MEKIVRFHEGNDTSMPIAENKVRARDTGRGSRNSLPLRVGICSRPTDMQAVDALPESHADVVGVVSRSPFEGEATAAWVRSLGYDAAPFEVGGFADLAAVPRVLLIHGVSACDLVPAGAVGRASVIVLTDASEPARVVGRARVIANGRAAAALVKEAIAQVLGSDPVGRVSMSPREQEVLATYVLGATVAETAAAHFIAECTVRTHYRRVSRRYEERGHAVANKAQLLLAMVADGWLRLDGTLGPAEQQ